MRHRIRAVDGERIFLTACEFFHTEYYSSIGLADELVPIYGGYGYTAGYPAERAYRDARINRIFEGTNEINRLLVSSRLMKTAKNELIDEPRVTGSLAHENKLLRQAKTAALTSLRLAAQMSKLALTDQQVIMMGIADVIIDTYAMESAILRAEKPGAPSRYADMAQVFCADAIERIDAVVKNTITSIDEDGTVAARQRIAKTILS